MDATRTNAFVITILEVPLFVWLLFGLFDQRNNNKPVKVSAKGTNSSTGGIILFSPALLVLLIIAIAIWGWGQYRKVIESEKQYNAKHTVRVPRLLGDEDDESCGSLESEYSRDSRVV